MRPRALRRELRGLVRDSFATGSWQAATSVVDLVQLALVARVLGLHQYGRLAVVIGFVTLTGQFFDVRIGSTVLAFAARKLPHDVGQASGIFQLGYVVDGGTGVLGFAVVAGLAPFVAPSLVGHGGTALALLYATTLLLSTVDDTSVAIARVFDRFWLTSLCGVGLEALRLGAVAAALGLGTGLVGVLVALVAYDAAGAVVYLSIAARTLRSAGGSLVNPALARVRGERREFLGTVFHMNLLSYARLAQVQLPVVLLGGISGATAAGIYRIGVAAAAAVGRLSDPVYAASFPRFARLWSQGRRRDLVDLVRQGTILAGGGMSVALALVVVFRHPILSALGGDGRAVVPLVLAAVAQAVNGVLFWNTPLLLAARRARALSAAALIGTAVQLAVLGALVPRFAADGAAIALLASYATANVAATTAALRALARFEPQPAATPDARALGYAGGEGI